MLTQLEEKIKAYWDRQPCNVNHSQKELGTAEYFDEVTAKRYRAESHILDFAEFHKWRGKRVLEVGCGIGTDAEQFARHGAEYVGIDLSAESIGVALQRFKVYGLEGKFYVGSVTDLEFLQNLGQFDLVYSYGVLHHFPGMQQHIENISSIVVPHGEFRFMVYAKHSWKYAMIQKGLDQFEAQANCPYAEAFSENELRALLAGWFNPYSFKQDHCFMYNVPKYKQGIFELEPWFASMPDAMHAAIREHLGWHLLVKAHKHEEHNINLV
jgi:2-polyprenyl-3-methyl-5-hydroxy-6-metoxy-1,4-benzoquinol methylase